eukprot:TRINITY_DN35402_c0_g1_i1.p1 TRINITY_DN35402_c0_g1~~TRINITY_DN35402_c0_g1_i1.p1  ORF type:complete len:136 (-),score=5.52 TRINITY_DN35402_c0_g1_i1:37-417(-)
MEKSNYPPPYSQDQGWNVSPAPPVGGAARPQYQQPVGGGMVGVPIVVRPAIMGRNPVGMQCPNCQASITTRVEEDQGVLAWISAGVLCLAGCWLGCCLIPFCVDSFKDIKHFCPSCNALVGRYKAL